MERARQQQWLECVLQRRTRTQNLEARGLGTSISVGLIFPGSKRLSLLKGEIRLAIPRRAAVPFVSMMAHSGVGSVA